LVASTQEYDLLNEDIREKNGEGAVTIRAGCSIPIVADLGRVVSPVILTGIGLPDDGLHSPNEKLDLQQLWDGIEIFGRFFELLGEKGQAGQVEPEDEMEEDQEAGTEVVEA